MLQNSRLKTEVSTERTCHVYESEDAYDGKVAMKSWEGLSLC